MAQLILTALGDDRPGLVGELTGHLHAGNANILESRMVNLRGRFAVIILFESADPATIKAQLSQVAERMKLTLHLADHQSPGSAAAATPAPPAGLPYRLKTYSLDQPGLVHRISEVLRSHAVNIEDLAARQDSAPFAGDPLFIMEMKLTVPASVGVRKLRLDLEAACEKLNCDFDLEPA